MRLVAMLLIAVGLIAACGTEALPLAVSQPLPSAVPPAQQSRVTLPGYVRGTKDKHADRVIVFIHGLFGDGTSTWTNPSNHAYFPELVAEDKTFDGVDIWVHEFDTPKLRRGYTIDELADHLRKYLNNDNVITNHRQVIFICHSLGGLVARAYLLKYHDLAADRVPMIYFFSTPTTGSDLANIAHLISANPQLSDMRKMTTDDPSVLGVWEAQWDSSDFTKDTLSYCAYELLPTHGVYVVQRESARHLCNTRPDPVDRNHIDIVKPANNTSDDSYIAFREAYRDTFRRTPDGSRPPVWNLSSRDISLVRARNVTETPSCYNDCWSDTLSVAPGDYVNFSFYYRNAGLVTARDVRLRLEVPRVPISLLPLTATLAATNVQPTFGSVTVKATSPVLLVPAGTWSYVEDPAALTPFAYSSSSSQLTADGLSLGDVPPSGSYHSVLAQFRCEPVTLLTVPAEATRDRFHTVMNQLRAGTLAESDLSQPIATPLGHLDTGDVGEHTWWVSDVGDISDDGDKGVVLAFVSYLNNSGDILRRLRAQINLTNDSPDTATLRVTLLSAKGKERTASATLHYRAGAKKRLALIGAWHAPKTVQEALSTMDDDGSDPAEARPFPVNDDIIEFGDLPPESTVSAVMEFDMSPPTGIRLLTQVAPITPTVLNGETEDHPVLQVSNGFGSQKWVSRRHAMDREPLGVSLFFHNTGDAIARDVKLRLGFSWQGSRLSLVGKLQSANAAEKSSEAVVTYEATVPSRRLYYDYATIYRDQSDDGRMVDAASITTEGMAIGDLDPDEFGFVTVFFRTTPPEASDCLVVVPGQAFVVEAALRNPTGTAIRDLTFISAEEYEPHELRVVNSFRTGGKEVGHSSVRAQVPWTSPNVRLRYREAKLYTSMIGASFDASEAAKGVILEDLPPGVELFIRITYDVLAAQ